MASTWNRPGKPIWNSALTKEAVSLVLDVVEHPSEHHPDLARKQSLLGSHQLTD
jgi:hypothetical protein